MRGLSDLFMENLQGVTAPGGLDLSCVLNWVNEDSSLCLEIRENYINIYYRGGNIMKLTEANGSYTIYFDCKYFNSHQYSEFARGVAIRKLVDAIVGKPSINMLDVRDWLEIAPYLKHAMDCYFGVHPHNEREFQQLLVRENNFKGIAKGTDYFIVDIEYANDDGRFDMIAIQWPSTSADRKIDDNVGLAFIEMKYGDGALTGSSGIMDHIKSLGKYVSLPVKLSDLQKEIINVFNQKIDLGLIDNRNKIKGFNNEKPEFIFVFANHDPDSKILYNELQKVQMLAGALPFELKFATSNFMGYGLYKQNIYSLDDFLKIFHKQIYSKIASENE